MAELPPEELVYLREFLAQETHWCRLVGGPQEKMGMLVEVPKNEHNICIPHLERPPAFSNVFDPLNSQMVPVVKKLHYIRNPGNRTEFLFVR
jgi:hypothetical protein